MIVWIQRHDFQYEELPAATAGEAVAAFEAFDWASEIRKSAESGEEACPPGFGVVTDEGLILHLVPRDSGECMMHFHYPRKRRFLLLFSGHVRETVTREGVDRETCLLLIESMFLEDREQLMAIMLEIAGEDGTA